MIVRADLDRPVAVLATAIRQVARPTLISIAPSAAVTAPMPIAAPTGIGW
jgi:hypothetical protein